jgi:hypothetical protein
VVNGKGLSAALGILGEDPTVAGLEMKASTDGSVLSAYPRVRRGEEGIKSTSKSLKTVKSQSAVSITATSPDAGKSLPVERAQQSIGSANTAVGEKLPIKVGNQVFFVVPLSELPNYLQKQLKGKTAIAVVDEQGRIPKDRGVIFKALVAHRVALRLVDEGRNSGWDVDQAKTMANLYEDIANKLSEFRKRQGIADKLETTTFLAARGIVLGVLIAKLSIIDPSVIKDVPKSALMAFLKETWVNPKYLARMAVNGDLKYAENQLREGAGLLRSVKEYPLDSEVALKLFDIETHDFQLASWVQEGKLNIEGSWLKQLWEGLWGLIKKAAGTWIGFLAKKADPTGIVSIIDLVKIANDLTTPLRDQVPGWAEYEDKRREILDNWIRAQNQLLKMAEDIFNVTTVQSDTPTLTVTKSGTGSGTVTSNPAGINCGTDCSEPYPSGTKVTLTATPSSGSIFAGWGGDCSSCGAGSVCPITMDANRTCTATFRLPETRVQWAKTYGGPGLDEASSIQQTADGGYVIAGSTQSFGAGGDIWVLKLDRNGNIQWQKTYGGPRLDLASSIQQTSDGGYVVAGTTLSSDAGGDIWVLKLDANGDIGGCSLIGTSNATVSDTNVNGVTTSVSPKDTSVSAQDSTAIIRETTVTSSQQCGAP